MDVLDKILYHIRKQGLTDREFCEMAGLANGTVTGWKSGRTKSYLRHVPKIAEVLKIDRDYLIPRNISNKSIVTADQVIVLQRAADENGMEESELEDILAYAKFKYPHRFTE